MDDIGISAYLVAKQCDIRNFFVSSERSLPDLNDTLWYAILVIQAFEFDFIFKDIQSSSLLFSSKHCKFYLFSTYFFDNITLCINLPTVTLSNMSHLVYITLFGETDGVTLSRLGCSSHPLLWWFIIESIYGHTTPNGHLTNAYISAIVTNMRFFLLLSNPASSKAANVVTAFCSLPANSIYALSFTSIHAVQILQNGLGKKF